MEKPLPFASRLRELRELALLSQDDVAARIGVQQKTVSSWETGRTEASASDIAALARVLRCSADYLVGLTSATELLPPGHWIIDLDVYERGKSGKPVGDDELIGVPIPPRFQIVDSTRYAAMSAEARSGAKNKRRGGSRER